MANHCWFLNTIVYNNTPIPMGQLRDFIVKRTVYYRTYSRLNNVNNMQLSFDSSNRNVSSSNKNFVIMIRWLEYLINEKLFYRSRCKRTVIIHC
jgi:hypothetical protein